MSVHTGDVNKTIDVETGIDLTGMTVSLRVAPPNAKKNSAGSWSPVFEYAGSVNGTKIRHTKTGATFNTVGVWHVQAKVIIGSEIEYGAETTLSVYPSL